MSSAFLLSLVAVSLIVASTLRFAVVGFQESRNGARLRNRRASDLNSLRRSARVARLNSQLSSSSAGKQPWRVMEVAEVVQESLDCKSYYLVDPYKQKLPAFFPGQYLMIRPAIAGEFKTTRCYSLSSSPNSTYWRITVKEQLPEDDTVVRSKNGGLSAWLHREIEAGDCLLVGEPGGNFFLDPENRQPLVLLAAGIGITPMISMLRWSIENTPGRPVHLHFQAKTADHWPLGATGHQWQESFPHIEATSYFSRASEDEIHELEDAFPGNFKSGRMSIQDIVGLPGTNYFMCGPEKWMSSIRSGLCEHGVDESACHWESFGGTGAQPTLAAEGDVDPVEVKFEGSEVSASWCNSEQSLWELARESGVEIPSGCLSGVCGSCRVKYRDGEVKHDRKVGLELAADECLSCIARPVSPVTIEV